MFEQHISPLTETKNLDRLIAHYPGPAFVLSRKGTVISTNEKAAPLLCPDQKKPAEEIREIVHAHVLKVLDTEEAHSWHLKCADEDGADTPKSFMVSGMPFPAGKQNCVLLLCMETSAETAIRDALIESRAFYKDFSDFSCEFAWTTDENGRFSYVSEKGILGLPAQELYGMDPAALLAEDQDPKLCQMVFTAQTPVSNMDIFLEYEGVRKCYRFSVEPVFDPLGIWQGARGIASDITLLKEREAELMKIKDVETRTRNVVDAIRAEIRPEAMLETAVSSIIRAGGKDACWIFHAKPDAKFIATDSPVIWAMKRQTKELTDGLKTEYLREIIASYMQDGCDDVKLVHKDGLNVHLVRASYGERVYGVLCFVRVAEESAKWDEADSHFYRTIADQTAISLGLFEQHARLQHLSRTDSLTGLLNRRAFTDEASRVLSHHKRMKRPAVMIYIDLDNFKTINDTHGHNMGDKVLDQVSRLIKKNCRLSDLPVRFGGDEFGILMQESDETVALIKANDLIDGCIEIAKEMQKVMRAEGHTKKGLEALCDCPEDMIGFSVGISVFNPYQPETLEELIGRADSALYDVKASGKGGYRLAVGPEQDHQNSAQNPGLQKRA